MKHNQITYLISYLCCSPKDSEVAVLDSTSIPTKVKEALRLALDELKVRIKEVTHSKSFSKCSTFFIMDLMISISVGQEGVNLR